MEPTPEASPVYPRPARPPEHTSRQREYLSAKQLAQVTPWSVEAIQKMVHRGVLRCDVHYFQPFGQRTQLVFKWSAIVALVERNRDDADVGHVVARRANVIDVEKAKAGLDRLLRR